jgi:hypothetical protein
MVQERFNQHQGPSLYIESLLEVLVLFTPYLATVFRSKYVS